MYAGAYVVFENKTETPLTYLKMAACLDLYILVSFLCHGVSMVYNQIKLFIETMHERRASYIIGREMSIFYHFLKST